MRNFEIHNLTTTNAMLMELSKILNLHETFYLAKIWGITHRECSRNFLISTTNEVFGLISWNIEDYIKNRYISNGKYCPTLLLKTWKESDCIWKSYGQKTSQKHPKRYFLLVRKHFNIHNLANTTYHNYVSPWVLLFA